MYAIKEYPIELKYVSEPPVKLFRNSALSSPS